MYRTQLLSISLFLLFGCEGASSDVLVIALDENGEQVAADEVYWYFAPETPEYDGEHALDCVDESCTEWVIQNAPSALFYVAGDRDGSEHNDPYCGFSGYDGQPVEFNGVPVTITLDLTLHEWCQDDAGSDLP
jgi:hypothetical protein